MLQLSFHDDKHPPVTLDQSRLTIGRDESNDLVLKEDGISGFHAEIQLDEESIFLIDMDSTNGTCANGEKITQSNLNDGDEIKIEPYLFSVKGPATTVNKTVSRPTLHVSTTRVGSAADSVQDADPIPAAILKVVKGLNQGQSFEVRSHQASIGRSDDNDIVLPFETVSGCHAMLAFANGSWTIQDQESVNGVFVNNKEVTSHKLESNDQIAIGAVVLQFKIPALQFGYGRTRRTALVTKVSGADKRKAFRVSPWMYGLMGFWLATIIIIAVMMVIHWNRTKITAMPLQAGKVWETDLSGRRQPTTPALADINGDKFLDVIVPTGKMGLVALDGHRGWLIWDTREMILGKCITSPIRVDVNGDGTMDFVAVTNKGQVLAVTTRNGKPWKLWEKKVPSKGYASPLFMEVQKHGIVVIATDNKGVFAFDAGNGNRVWHAQSDNKFFASPLASDVNGDDVPDVILAADDGKLIILNGLTGDTIWRLALNNGLQASPCRE
jgi:pSer/pThr/pTyr-binding forkhead associated (FHA) protein